MSSPPIKKLKRLAGRVLPRLLQHVPKTHKWLRPFYNAGQLRTSVESYRSNALPSAFDGLVLGYASDIHFGPFMDAGEALALQERLLDLNSDILLLGGDYGDIPANSTAFFQAIRPFPEGLTVLAAIGNHDHGDPAQSLEPMLWAMREKNIIPMVNQAFSLNREGQRLVFLFPDDILSGQPDLQALKEQAEGADFSIFVPHSPDLIPEAQAIGLPFDLAICGHTHAGQLVLFGRSIHASSRYKDRYRVAWIQEGGADILVSSGVGCSIVPMRIGTLPEIHRLTLLGQEESSPEL